MAHDMRQLLMGADLAVSHIQEIGFTGNPAQRIPSLNVQGIIGAITGVGVLVQLKFTASLLGHLTNRHLGTL